MAYETILVHVDQSGHVLVRICIDERLAATENAHSMCGNKRAQDALAQFKFIAMQSEACSYERRLLSDDHHDGMEAMRTVTACHSTIAPGEEYGAGIDQSIGRCL